MMTDKITICIPTYNRKHRIVNAIESLLNQTYSNFEIVICDNASTDDTKSILNYFQDKRIRYVYFDEHLTVNYSFIRALNQANSEYICLFHSDDWYYPDIIEKGIKYLKNQNVGAVFTLINQVHDRESIALIPERDEKYTIDIFDYKKYLKMAMMTVGPGLNCPTFMTKKSVLEKVGILKKQDSMISDMSFWLAIVKQYDIIRINTACMNYFISEEQLSSKIFNNGHSVVAPSYILIDNEINMLSFFKKMKYFPQLIKYKYKRAKEFVRVNRLRNKLNMKKYNFLYFIIQNKPFTTNSLALSENDYLDKLYKINKDC